MGQTMTELYREYYKEKMLGIQPKNERVKKNLRQVLLADDEVAFRQLYSDILHIMGFEVTGCKDGLEAFKAFSKSPEKFHLILTDYMMPRIDGVKLAKKIREINKNVPIVLCTGVPDNIDRLLLKDKIINVLLVKPLGLSEFATSINRLLLDR